MRALVAALAALILGGADAPPPTPVVTATAPNAVAVTVYRDPNRRAGGAIDRRDPNGFALITETRTVAVPAGTSTIRFVGVAQGIIPVSAIVTGLPGGTVEKNRDARLLSPAALVDGTLGRRVTLRRTDRATGVVREEDATIVAGPDRGVVLRTGRGIEVLGCSGLPEKPVYAGVPAGLSAEPVLSVTTRSPRAATVTVTLSYLATGFDWNASYVATLARDGRTLDLFAWLTLANANPQSFPGAKVSAVAGRLERRFVRDYARMTRALVLQCYPLGTTTSNLSNEDIVVTGARVMMAESAPPPAFMAPPPPPPPAPPAPPPPEDLGDLKLYRVPDPVTVAANQQKQVALLHRAGVRFERVYALSLYPGTLLARPVAIELRAKNDTAAGLGVPLPSGTTALYGDHAGERALLGLGRLDDVAAGGKVRIAAGTSPSVMAAQTLRDRVATVTLTNASPRPATVEVRIGGAGQTTIGDFSRSVSRVDGVWTWRAVVPGQGTAELTYSLK